jgi:putative membrane fusion protein
MDKRYLSRVLVYLLLAVFAIALICEIGYQFYKSVYEDVETAMAEETTFYYTVEATGYVFRSEQTLVASSEGAVRYLCSDGEKISKGQSVAKIYDFQEDNNSILEEISKLEAEEEILTSAQTMASGYSTKKVETEIADLRNRICSLTAEGDLLSVEQLDTELRQLLAVSQIVTGNVKNYSAEISSLKQKIAEKEEQLGQVKSSVSSLYGGYFYSQADGMEDLLDPSDLSSLTFDDFLNVLTQASDTTSSASDTWIGKIVTDYKWYVFCVVSQEESELFLQDKTYSVCLQGMESSMQLCRIVNDSSENSVVLVFSSDQIPDNFNNTRIQNLSIVCTQSDGFAIPSGALRSIDGITGVFVLHGSVVQFRQVEILYSQEGMIFSSASFQAESGYTALSRYDLIILNGKDLYVGKIID